MTIVHVRVDADIKAQAAMGLTLSDAVRVFLTRIVADQKLPFALRAPTATRRETIAQARQMIEVRQGRCSNPEALIDGLEKNRSE